MGYQVAIAVITIQLLMAIGIDQLDYSTLAIALKQCPFARGMENTGALKVSVLPFGLPDALHPFALLMTMTVPSCAVYRNRSGL